MTAITALIVKLIVNSAKADDDDDVDDDDDDDDDGGNGDYEEILRDENTFPRDWFDRLAHPIHEGRKPITWR